MKNNYNMEVKLRCATCGDDSSFEMNEDKSFVKCKKCGREYPGGYDELVSLNQEAIEGMKTLMTSQINEDFVKSIKDIFKGNKNIRIS